MSYLYFIHESSVCICLSLSNSYCMLLIVLKIGMNFLSSVFICMSTKLLAL